MIKFLTKKKTLILGLILALAALLRFYQLDQVPPSPDWDEAALGWNAYSIMKTGRDEYGQLLPFFLRSFDDYKPAVYAYLAILPIKLFGLNLWATRFSAAFLGVVAVGVVFLLIKELFKKDKLALITSFLLAISPWHLQFSRPAFEANVGLLFNLLVILFFLKSRRKPFYLILSAFFAGLNLYVYQADKIFTPLLVLILAIIWRRELFKLSRRYLIAAIAVGFLMTLPFIHVTLTTPQIFLRARGTSFAADATPFLARTVEKLVRDHKRGDYLGLFLDNRRVTYLLSFVHGYLSHFDLTWFFITGDEARHHAPGTGLLYLWELPFLLIGLYQLIFSRFSSKTKALIFSWFFLAPLPAAFTSGVPHAIRSLRFLPLFQVFIGSGLIKAWEMVKKKKLFLKASITGIALLFFVFNFSYYLNQYFNQLNYFDSQAWQYGYQEAVEKVKEIEGEYEKIIVSNQQPLDQSYMFFLFYLQYDPATYQQEGGTKTAGFAETHDFDKYQFRPIEWAEEEKGEKALYVGRPGDFPEEGKLIKTINFLDGEPAIKIVQGS